ncbi:damage-inducible protein DinB [Paenibacillus sp. JCM 10914]|uniref:DinB family protein n=1 Tax=Paenibacillus sp. JCM 10914 TaxID=1236974 RepID=UPI0003CC8F7D|nr:DinB family protein [Paenibacillus sp. JCM 10914]GAE06412.1 nuclease inhibitor [Paenibacillus sp. JCM 10914]
MNHCVEMYTYHTWANQTILSRIKELPSTVLREEVNTSFPTIAHALNHIYMVEKTWYLVLTGVEMPEAFQACMPLAERMLHSVDEYIEAFRELSNQYNEWFKDQVDLEQTIRLNNPFAAIRDTRLSEIVLQVVNHGTYHRGNISTMLRQLGHASTMNDYSLFWYQERVETSI